MSDIFENKGALAATIVVAASNSLNKGQANYVCDGVNDHIEIQAALDALPATGGEVKLLDGRYNIESSLILDSYQTLRGCGRNTILTTHVAHLDFITATGGAGTEKVGIRIHNLCIDGNAGGVATDNAIKWGYVVYSEITNTWLMNATAVALGVGIKLANCDNNIIASNIFINNACTGIFLTASTHISIVNNDFVDNDFGVYDEAGGYNTITGNTFHGGSQSIFVKSDHCSIVANICEASNSTGIHIEYGDYCTITGNFCSGHIDYAIYATSRYGTIIGNVCINSGYGIYTSDDYNTISGNNCVGNGYEGISIKANHNTVSGNTCVANSQDSDNSYAGIGVDGDYNLVIGNTCRRGAGAAQQKYGIEIWNAEIKNKVQGNDLNDGGKTGNFYDAGTLTHVEDDNRGITIDQIKMFRYVKNTSGAQRVAGDVVSLKAVAAGNEVTAPAAIGERQVYGMVAETINDAAWGLVQVKGKTTALKGTNAGGGNIVIGDNLITENGVRARKAAAATDPIFARALEALAAADGVIDAYILSPWD